MSLICHDIDYIIASHIFNSYYRDGCDDLKNIMISFGKSSYDDFIGMCRCVFFRMLFARYKCKDVNVCTLLQKLSHKNNIKHFQCYNKFNDNLGNNQIIFRDLRARHRQIVYYLSLYHGYLWLCTKTYQREKLGYNYSYFHDDEKGPFKYRLLKRKRIHNLIYYDLVEKGNTLMDSTFVLKRDARIYKLGVTTESKDITCIKIL
uniref:Uncharacterized protein n=1 Tax=Marseillevirus LCMAC201 TaxID=2506605 RepID=A0A481YVQ9_9VIRU|nr:MAG: hypothetical protein LCMAC201_01640 [Marseillevirus LCMAC201]